MFFVLRLSLSFAVETNEMMKNVKLISLEPEKTMVDPEHKTQNNGDKERGNKERGNKGWYHHYSMFYLGVYYGWIQATHGFYRFLRYCFPAWVDPELASIVSAHLRWVDQPWERNSAFDYLKGMKFTRGVTATMRKAWRSHDLSCNGSVWEVDTKELQESILRLRNADDFPCYLVIVYRLRSSKEEFGVVYKLGGQCETFRFPPHTRHVCRGNMYQRWTKALKTWAGPKGDFYSNTTLVSGACVPQWFLYEQCGEEIENGDFPEFSYVKPLSDENVFVLKK